MFNILYDCPWLRYVKDLLNRFSDYQTECSTFQPSLQSSSGFSASSHVSKSVVTLDLFDCVIEFRNSAFSSRCVVVSENSKLSYESESQCPNGWKFKWTTQTNSLFLGVNSEVSRVRSYSQPPFSDLLRDLKVPIVAHLERNSFVRVMTLSFGDFIASIHDFDKLGSGFLHLDVHFGKVDARMCADSYARLSELTSFVSKQLQRSFDPETGFKVEVHGDISSLLEAKFDSAENLDCKPVSKKRNALIEHEIISDFMMTPRNPGVVVESDAPSSSWNVPDFHIEDVVIEKFFVVDELYVLENAFKIETVSDVPTLQVFLRIDEVCAGLFGGCDFEMGVQDLHFEDEDDVSVSVDESVLDIGEDTFSSEFAKETPIEYVEDFFHPEPSKVRESSAVKRHFVSRNLDELIEVVIKNIHSRIDVLSLESLTANRIFVEVSDVTIKDCYRSSLYKNVLSKLRHEGSYVLQPFLRGELKTMRRSQASESPLEEEFVINLFLGNMRITVDQRTLMFLSNFFDRAEIFMKALQATYSQVDESSPLPSPSPAPLPPPFVQKCELNSFVAVIDYRPRKVKVSRIRKGNFGEAINMCSVSNMKFILPRCKVEAVEGFDNVFSRILSSWTEDIVKHQIHKYFSSITPLKSLKRVGSGFADMVLLPIEQYNLDKDLKKGLKKGAVSASRKIGGEAMDFASFLFGAAAATLDSIRVPDTSSSHSMGVARPSPSGIKKSLMESYFTLMDGLEDAAHRIVVLPRDEYKHGGATATAKSAVAAIPSSAFNMMSQTFKAASIMSAGISSFLDRKSSIDENDKYKEITKKHKRKRKGH